MVKPITPSEADVKRLDAIPELVITAFNDLIVKNLRGNSARVTRNEVVDRITQADNTISRTMIFEKGWLDIEPLYRQAGWKVKFDKPSYDETYDAFFLFTKE